MLLCVSFVGGIHAFCEQESVFSKVTALLRWRLHIVPCHNMNNARGKLI